MTKTEQIRECKTCGSDECNGWQAELAELLDENKPTKIRDFVVRLLGEQKEEINKKVKFHNMILKSMIAEVQDRNGLPYCKNCSLSEENIIKL